MHPVWPAVFAFFAIASPPLSVIKIDTTPNGFNSPSRGWNSFGLQADPLVDPSFVFNQTSVKIQADALNSLLSESMKSSHDYYISLDSGWSDGSSGDAHGRIVYNSTLFNLPELAAYLHAKNLKLGIYVLPGAFCSDENKTIAGTSKKIKNMFSKPITNNGFARCDLDYSKPLTQTWHDSVVDLFAKWGIDFIKLDFITPGSPDNGGNLPPNDSGSVIAYHKAISNTGRQMRLDISWKLDRNKTFFTIWENNADSMRTDQDLNNYGEKTLVSWATVQRAIENYRQYITQVTAETGDVLTIYPDMDNLFVANPKSQTGVNRMKRQTIMTHWIGAAANLIWGSDMTNVDAFGKKLITYPGALKVADFTQTYPMQPRNPGTGKQTSKQLQAWIAGPDPNSGKAICVLANYGPDQGQGGFGTKLKGRQKVAVTWEDLGLSGSYAVENVWTGQTKPASKVGVSAVLGEGESQLLWLTPKS